MKKLFLITLVSSCINFISLSAEPYKPVKKLKPLELEHMQGNKLIKRETIYVDAEEPETSEDAKRVKVVFKGLATKDKAKFRMKINDEAVVSLVAKKINKNNN